MSSQQITLQPGEQRRLDEILNHFTHICVSAIVENPEIPVSYLCVCVCVCVCVLVCVCVCVFSVCVCVF